MLLVLLSLLLPPLPIASSLASDIKCCLSPVT
jgi:hypothetical protein